MSFKYRFSNSIIKFLQVFHFSFFIFHFTASAQKALTPQEVFFKTMTALHNVKTCKYHLEMSERINGEHHTGIYNIKWQAKPFKCYIYSIAPASGAEVLYIEGKNNNELLINPNRFPFINLNLSPYNTLIRKNHQFTTLQSGYGYLIDILEYYLTHNRNEFLSYLSLDKDVFWDKRTFYQLVMNFEGFKWIPYTVKKGETITSISIKTNTNDRMILEKNPKYKNYDSVNQGDVIQIPNAFCKKLILYVDKQTFVPAVQLIYDDKGLFTNIQFHSLQVNPVIKDEEFTKDFKEYGF